MSLFPFSVHREDTKELNDSGINPEYHKKKVIRFLMQVDELLDDADCFCYLDRVQIEEALAGLRDMYSSDIIHGEHRHILLSLMEFIDSRQSRLDQERIDREAAQEE